MTRFTCRDGAVHLNRLRFTPEQAERFSTSYVVDPVTGCWVWKTTRGKPYGRIMISGKRSLAHRLSYEHFVGQIPAGMFVCHRCDNPPCVNPDHLWLGTMQDNVADRDAKGRGADHRGSKNGRATWDEAAVIRARHLRSTGMKIQAVADLMGVSHQCVKRATLGNTWRHL